MSGIEIAGLVLATIPLAISGLEHYADGVGTIRKLGHIREHFHYLRTDLEVEQVIFMNTLETLLSDTLGPQICNHLLTQLGGSSWYDSDVDRRLREGLQRSYDVFFKSVQRIEEALRDLMEALQLDGNGKGPFSMERRSIAEGLKRLKFGLRMKKYQEQLDVVKGCNGRLLKLAAQSSTLSRQTRRPVRAIPHYQDLRNHAVSIFESLSAGLSRSCKEQHRVNLCMKPFAAQTDDEELQLADSPTFKVVFEHCGADRPAGSAVWDLEETDIRMLNLAPHPGNGVQSLQRLAQTRSGKVAKAQQYNSPLHEISDICTGLSGLKGLRQAACLGYMADIQNNFQLSLFWPNRRMIIGASLSAISLAEVLDGPQQLWVSDLDKRNLALSLASGMLTLSGTAWLSNGQWGKRDITVFRQPSGVLLSRPFVTQQLYGPSRVSQAYFETCSLIRDEATFALGVLLIELCMGHTLDDLRAPEDLTPDGLKHKLSDFLTAARLVDEVYGIAGSHWGDVVRRCVHCEFDQRNVGLGNADFRQAVYERVVAVLEKDVQDAQSW
ncbi:hypothetical protein CBER1_07654 [Cercospora berteroae]|uniref:DUF7580 domain-containing protein n=1 Tax=Cercospora berteroae TaxID=357750 RepID=A0A2S6C4L7_9PEZI|nr:hypothetical protein CBER1_07654 [Cercospora berteroae]